MNRDDFRSSRILIFTIVIFASIGLYAFKLFYMQILQCDLYRKQ